VASACSIDDPNLAPMMSQGHGSLRRGGALVADALGVELDEIVCEAEYAQTTEDVEMASWTIKAGCVAGVFASWQGRVGGKTVVDLNVRWRKGQTLDPDWKVEGDPVEDHHRRTAHGDNASRLLPPPDFDRERKTIEDFMVARPHHHGDAADPRDSRGRRRGARDRDLQRLPLPQARGVVPTGG
jgi:hypothetical protein